MIFTNGLIFRGEEGFIPGGFTVEKGRFTEVFEESPRGDVDLQGAKVIPGLVDIHIHGALGADFSDGDQAGLARMGTYLATRGITSFLPTSMTLPYETLQRAFATAASLKEQLPQGCARILGIHMEGPFFSEKKKGAQNGAYLKNPDAEAFLQLQKSCGGLIRLVDVAPELEGALNFTRAVSSENTLVSAAHTDADYEESRALYDAGANHLTHLYNAMPGIHHREPGVIGAASEAGAFAELISDGYHVHPSAVRMAFKLFPHRICLISDALRCLGMPEGEYELGGQQIRLKDGVARLPEGTIAGAARDLFEDMQNAIAFGIPEAEAILAASLNPARSVNLDREVGSIEVGKLGDFVICDNALKRQAVYIGGTSVPEGNRKGEASNTCQHYS